MIRKNCRKLSLTSEHHSVPSASIATSPIMNLALIRFLPSHTKTVKTVGFFDYRKSLALLVKLISRRSR